MNVSTPFFPVHLVQEYLVRTPVYFVHLPDSLFLCQSLLLNTFLYFLTPPLGFLVLFSENPSNTFLAVSFTPTPFFFPSTKVEQFKSTFNTPGFAFHLGAF